MLMGSADAPSGEEAVGSPANRSLGAGIIYQLVKFVFTIREIRSEEEEAAENAASLSAPFGADNSI